MNNTYGSRYRFTIFGESHSETIGTEIEGLAEGTVIDTIELQAFMERRAPGRNRWSTSRKEPDVVEFGSGIKKSTDEGDSKGLVETDGGLVRAMIRNTNRRSSDYKDITNTPRPGHADFTAMMRSGVPEVTPGGGVFSGRMTAPLCIAGGIAIQILKKEGISISARADSVGGMTDEAAMKRVIEKAASEGDSVGGTIICEATGVPEGVGDPMFGGMENRIAGIVFGIPAVKAIEFGAGFEVAKMRGSENNDPFYIDDGKVRTRTNNAGGILGGMTNGMPVVFRAAVKPTPSISIEQDSVNMLTMDETRINIKGRHDPCIVFRAVPVMEAAMACALLDAIYEKDADKF